MRTTTTVAFIRKTNVSVLLGSVIVAFGALATTKGLATLDISGDRATLTVEKARPVAQGVIKLVKEYEILIRRNYAKYAPGSAPKVIVPKGGRLVVSG